MLGQCKDGCGLCTDSSCNNVRVNHGKLPTLFRAVSWSPSVLVLGRIQSLEPVLCTCKLPHPLQICKGDFLLLHGVFVRPARECMFLVNMLETTSR